MLNELLVPLSKHQTEIILPAQTNCNVKFAKKQIYVLQTLSLRDQTADNNDLNKSLDNDNNGNSAQIIYKIGPWSNTTNKHHRVVLASQCETTYFF